MRNAARILIIGALALAACHKDPPANEAANADLSPDAGLNETQMTSNAEIETLPPDESSTTPSSELNSGEDNPDVNSVTDK